MTYGVTLVKKLSVTTVTTVTNPKNKIMANQPELKLQQQCYRFFHNHYPSKRGLLWKTENERKRNRYEQAIAKSTGLVAGVSDFLAFYAGNLHAIELKTEKGTLSKPQRRWALKIETQGGTYTVIRSLSEFQELIRSIFGDPE